MNLQEFLSLLWSDPTPDSYCLVAPSVRYYVSADISSALSYQNRLNIWFSPARFRTPDLSVPRLGTSVERSSELAISARAFWLDIDVKPGEPDKGYENYEEAHDALTAFVAKVALPDPLIVRSGAGIHAYFLLQQPIFASEWNRAANALYDLCAQEGFKADKSRTRDMSSLLRLPGTINKKDERERLPVVIEDSDYTIVSFPAFEKAVTTALKGFSKPKPSVGLQKLRDLSSQITDLATTGEVPDADAIRSKCASLQFYYEKRGDVSEPAWYKALGILAYCKDSEQKAVEWSGGHPDFDPEDTLAKMEQWKERTTGATTCESMSQADEYAAHCRKCPYRQSKKLVSPITFGLGTKSEDAGKNFLGYELAKPYYITDNGAIMVTTDDGVPVVVSERTVGITDVLLEPERPGVERVTYEISYRHVKGGVRRVMVDGSMLPDKTNLVKKLAAYGYLRRSAREDEVLVDYLRVSANLAAAHVQPTFGYRSFGWHDGSFYLGETRYMPGGETAAAKRISDDNPTIPKGELHAWKHVVEHYLSAPRGFMLPFLIGLGAPFLHYSSTPGLVVNLYAPDSGIGKSTCLSAVQAVWGNPEQMMRTKSDTTNALLRRLGEYKSVPVCVDEFSVVEGKELESFLYTVSGGKERERLGEGGRTKIKGGEWRTAMLTSSNTAFGAKIGRLGSNSDGVINRMLEFRVCRYASDADLREINKLVRANFGVLGAAMIAQHMQDIEKGKKALESVERFIRNKVSVASRFHVDVYAAAVYGYALACGVLGIPVNTSAVLAKMRMTAVGTNDVQSVDGVKTKYSEAEQKMLAAGLSDYMLQVKRGVARISPNKPDEVKYEPQGGTGGAGMPEAIIGVGFTLIPKASAIRAGMPIDSCETVYIGFAPHQSGKHTYVIRQRPFMASSEYIRILDMDTLRVVPKPESPDELQVVPVEELELEVNGVGDF
ncbi:DUF927 domain-containing protein [Candidatus Igneacidithiobacillus taiwanensis]|uniref:DUF927 domain-containing protein n=1 Tax=Candidatus Igneacidithiobacillus taiwanensis TaxID=1945924 RepID=UPI00289C52D2|nr:DUF927 domain-containing protein [Candidatus Igneacidithiobacillus taiwanensis]